jgi:hypothetical protein
MPQLSFEPSKEAKPIAIVKGGADDGKILYLHEDSGGKPPKPKTDFVRARYTKFLEGKKPSEKTRIFNEIHEALEKGLTEEHLPSSHRELYERIRRDLAMDKSIVLDDEGMFELLPSCKKDKREVWYVAGQSGSGKSYIAKGLANNYHKLYPDRGVYLVSKLEKDDTLDALKFLKRVNIQSFVDDYPSLDEFKDSFIIFDDYDTLTGNAGKVVTKIIDDLAIQGRHVNVTMACLSHYLTNYKATRLILNEATHIVVYPLSTSYHALKYLLKNYVGVEEEDLKRQRKFGSRWLMYSKGYPQYMVSQKNAELLHQSD